MNSRWRSVVQAVTLLIALATAGGAMAQTEKREQMIGSDVTDRKRTPGAVVPGARRADDDAIPAPMDLATGTTPRAFVESFLVAVASGDARVVYETYLDEGFQRQVPQAPFVRRMGELSAAVGDLELLAIQHLVQKNAEAGRRSHGEADYILVFERDDRVEAHVEFVLADDGLWKVTTYLFDSPRLQRLYRGETEPDDSERAGGSEPSPPSSP